tara:strand:+ start:362 stop:472 length:111 start_codon:yes stop_codon:yes gene_type:complete
MNKKDKKILIEHLYDYLNTNDYREDLRDILLKLINK